jgi:general secretion pathway protein A
MHEEYYGFVEKPFSLTPDPKYLYKSESHANAFDLLQYAIRRREGFVVVTGDIGTGKTTLCRAILEQLDRRTFTALVLNPFLSEEDLLRLILVDFGVVSREEIKRGRLAGVSKQELIDTLNEFLLSLLPLRAGALLIIDEAQNLPNQVLEQIRILSNLETDKEKLLQIVLVGQPNLRDLLKTPELRQLDQRISIRYELKPLNREETAAYVGHRLAIAGGGAAVSFAPKALDLVFRYTGGIPRLINLLCDRALLGGYSSRTNRITPPIVSAAAVKLELERPRRAGFGWVPRRAALVAGVAASVVAVAGIGAYSVILLQAHAAGLQRTLAQANETRPTDGVAAPAPAAGTPALPAAAPFGGGEPVATAGGAPAPAASVPPAPAAISDAPSVPLPVATPRYSIQVGSFRQELEAAKLVDLLGRLGYQVRSSRVDGARGVWHKVFLGPYTSLEQARQDEARVRLMPGYADARLVTY